MLLDRQARGAEIGRIRLGTSTAAPKGRKPVKLDRLRFTSRSKPAITRIAALYGGEVREWVDGAPTPGQWEVITHAPEIPVAVPPGEQVLTQDYELWVKGVRKTQCDGQTERLRELRPCLCAAQSRRLCKPYSRLRVILPDVPGGGTWTLATQGSNAADELAGVARLMQAYADRGSILPAVLRLEQRVTMTDEGTNRYVVPVLQLSQSFRELAAQPAGTVALPPPPANLAAIEAAKPALPAPVAAGDVAVVDAEVVSPSTPPGGFERPRDATHLARMIEECPPNLQWVTDVRGRAEKAGWLDEWVDTRYSDAMARLREVLDWRTEEIEEAGR
jgi:Recombination directionality factor-like